MTEIPEHLLQRSRERREALGLSEPGTAPAAPAVPAETTASALPATAASAPPAVPPPPAAPAPPPPPKPDPPYIAAAKRRKRIPFWAMPVLVMLPVWAAVYAFTLEPPSAGANDPLVLGSTLYNGTGTCATCHGSQGEGGVGASFQHGDLAKTFPNWRDQFAWVKLGAAAWPGDSYGAALVSKAKLSGVMPGFGTQLTDDQILLLVRYEREVLSGVDPDPTLDALTECAALGTDLTSVLDPIGKPGNGPGGTSEPPATPETCAGS